MDMGKKRLDFDKHGGASSVPLFHFVSVLLGWYSGLLLKMRQ